MDCKKELKKKLGESYGRMMKLWMASTPSQLVAAAEEIAAARFIHDNLVDAVTEGDAAFLLCYNEDPLTVMRDRWIGENGSGMVHDDDLIHCVVSLSQEKLEEGAPVTVREFLAQHPGDSFEMMSPGCYYCLNPEEANHLLAGENATGEPGAYPMRIADELLPQCVGSQRLERGVWYLGIYDPKMVQEAGPSQGVTMC